MSVDDLLDDLSSAWNVLDVDFVEGDSEIIELALEALAITAPTSRIHREGHRLLPYSLALQDLEENNIRKRNHFSSRVNQNSSNSN